MSRPHEEWLKQSAYDLDTAEFMWRGGRHFYAMFMCHLSVEKALKALWQVRLGETPPKTHNLLFLVGRCGLEIPHVVHRILAVLNEAQVTTRYPPDLDQVSASYNKSAARDILDQAKDALEWIRQQF
ncbi:MAG: HEPN domain-containing protein [Candidatus Hydrogenedentes bacterium]|nr:HEPN domain-containing protein [Candidatus Hydrogenedentota bacterium]